MAWLDFLKNGNELTELLIEGNNPYGASLLKATDVDQMAPHIQATEQVQAYVLGRVVLAGQGLWVLTQHQLLISEQAGGHAVHAFALNQLSDAECMKGKYGYTLRVTASGQRFSVYGTSAQMTAMFYEKLGQSVKCAPVKKPPQLDADDVAQVQHHFSDAALRLQHGATASAHAGGLTA
jgi:hypothetical protein